MDEPTSALSDSEVEYLFDVVRGLRDHDVAVVYISHRLDEVYAITDRITVLRDGRVVGSRGHRGVSRRALISMMVGRDLEVLYPKAPVELGDEVLRVDGLTYVQGRTKVLDDVSVTVRRGEIVGVAGLMGAGRTQLLEAIFGVYPPDSLTRHDPPGRTPGSLQLAAGRHPSGPGPGRGGPQAAEPGAGAVGDGEHHAGIAVAVHEPAAHHQPAQREAGRRARGR